MLDRLHRLEPEQRRYTLETLAARLRDAEQFDRLSILFADDDWMQARYAGSGGVYDGFVADLRSRGRTSQCPRQDDSCGQTSRRP